VRMRAKRIVDGAPGVGRRGLGLMLFLALATPAPFAASAASASAAETPVSVPGMQLAFAESPAQSDGTLIAVSVECLGPASQFCSGTVTLSARGHRATTPVSIRGGARESVFVPLRLADEGGPAPKVLATATTSQPLGPPATSSMIVRAH
jgi:hypothetical protein